MFAPSDSPVILIFFSLVSLVPFACSSATFLTDSFSFFLAGSGIFMFCLCEDGICRMSELDLDILDSTRG